MTEKKKLSKALVVYFTIVQLASVLAGISVGRSLLIYDISWRTVLVVFVPVILLLSTLEVHKSKHPLVMGALKPILYFVMAVLCVIIQGTIISLFGIESIVQIAIATVVLWGLLITVRRNLVSKT